MADQSDESDDLVVLCEKSGYNNRQCENGREESSEGEEVDLDDLIVLDESVETVESGEESRQSSDESDSGHLEVVAEVPSGHKECCVEAQKQNAELRELIRKLEEENSKLKSQLSKHSVDVEVLNDVCNTVKVVLRDKTLHEKYSAVIEAYVNTLLEAEKKAPSISPEPTTSFFVDKYSHGVEKEDVGEAWTVPLYDRVSGFLHSENESNEALKDAPYYGPICFNCDGNHTLNLCPKPHNAMKISQNRRQYAGMQQKSNKRYHLNSKYEALKPGEISEELRSALDLKPHQLPLYIYRMRVLGYPPGWLKEAKIESSGLNLYDTDGKIVVDEVEDGEVDLIEVKVQYDPTKLINFPGFNVPVPPNFKDEHREHKMPPLKMHQLRSELEKTMQPPKAQPYKKRKSSESAAKHSKRQKTTDRLDEDMEIEITSDGVDVVDASFQTPRSRTHQLRLESQSDGEDSAGSSHSVSSLEERRKQLLKELEEKSDLESSPSQSLTALEERKRRLMKELEEKSEDSQSDPECAIIDNVSDGPEYETVGEKTTNGVDVSNDSDPNTSNTNTDTPVNVTETDNSSREILKKSILSTPGTPVVKLQSKLPDSAQFAKDISEHIPFENLPCSTGTYDKMRAILQKTRQMANNL